MHCAGWGVVENALVCSILVTCYMLNMVYCLADGFLMVLLAGAATCDAPTGSSSSSSSDRCDNALHTACRYGHRKIAALLIEKGYDVNALGKNSKTPLLLAAAGGAAVQSPEQCISDNTLNLQQQQQQGFSARSECVLRAATGLPLSPAVAVAAATGSSSSNSNTTASNSTSSDERALLCADLLAAGATLLVTDSRGVSTIMAAAAGGLLPLLEQALAASAATDGGSSGNALRRADASGWTAMHWAAANGPDGEACCYDALHKPSRSCALCN